MSSIYKKGGKMNFKEQYSSYVYNAIKKNIYVLSNINDVSYVKTQLAILRKSVGNKKIADVLPIIIQYIPDEYIGQKAELSDGEQAILNTMQLYAIVNQGNIENLKVVEPSNPWENMGTSLSLLRNSNGSSDKAALDKRFNIMITSETYDEFLYHLRQMIRIIKSKKQIYIDFPKLGEDLFAFLKGKEDDVRISWSRQYYLVRDIVENRKGDKNE